MNNIKLTAIIPCYNFEKYVEQAVNSVISQNTNFGIQIFIVDDNSTDNTYKIVNEKYKTTKNVSIFQSSKNQGITKNLKDMFDKTNTPYVFCMDADDYLVDMNYLQRAVDFLENNNEFSLYCSGYQWLHNDGTTEPPNGIWTSNLENVKLDDLLSINHISFGRVFRNYKNLIQSWMHDGLHEDWLMNAEILKHGLARCEKQFCGMYRITKSGRITSLTEQQIQDKNIRTINAIKTHLHTKTITIIDSFVHNDRVADRLLSTVNWMKEDGHDVLLISNTAVDKKIIDNVKFYMYDSRNQLFEYPYRYNSTVDFWKYIGTGTEIHDIIPETQPHGLSVLINMFNAILHAKAQGYTHFQRLEVDAIHNEKSRAYIRQIPQMCFDSGKDGLFYYNDNKTPQDISFHYFYCKIDDFLAKIPRISCEEDYINYLKTYYGNTEFKIVEVFIRDCLRKNGDSNLMLYAGSDMYSHFPDTQWNMESSISSFGKKYRGCTTRLYHRREYNSETKTHIETERYAVFSYSFRSSPFSRKIVVEKENGEQFDLIHDGWGAGHWCWNDLSTDIKSISVYEDDEFLYKDYASECISYAKTGTPPQ